MKQTYAIDPAHSNVQFTVRHMMLSNVRGTFSSLKGEIVYDTEDLSASTVQAEIDVNSISTLDANRDTHLKSAEFFDAEQFPTMSFTGKSFEKTGDGSFRVSGDLVIHGVTKPVVLQVEDVSPEVKDPWGNTRIGASARVKISRKEFGLTWNAALETGGMVVGDEIKIELEIEAVKKN